MIRMEIVAKDTTYMCKEGCFECCTMKLEIHPIEAYEISEKTSIPVTDFIDYTSGLGTLNVRKIEKDGEPLCFFLKDGKCSINDYKPITCRLYPLGLIVEYSDALETGKIISEAVDVKRDSCMFEEKEQKEFTLTSEEIKEISEKVIRTRATMDKLNDELKEKAFLELYKRATQIYKEISLGECIKILKKRAGKLEYNIINQAL